MSQYNLIATTAFGLESVVVQELRNLGYNDVKVDNGRVAFIGDEQDIVRCNLWLRCADRLLLQLAEFKALDFEELFQGTIAVPWEKYIPENGVMHVVGKSIKSKLFSVPDCQSIVKKGVIESMKRKYSRSRFEENGPVFKIEIALLKDIATLTIDTSGAGLHKRGYRLEGGEAPLRETLAASIILLSRWDPSRLLIDPFCGSGTIPIEAALIAKNIAPGINRRFVSEEWTWIPKKIWDTNRQKAKEAINDISFIIYASDSDKNVFNKARQNALNAGVADYITFQKKPVAELSSKKKFGCIICNPPYGERLGDKNEAVKLYKTMGEVFQKLDSWSYFILTSNTDFEKYFEKKSDKNRKLYNGKIKTYLYQYYGPLPGREEV